MVLQENNKSKARKGEQDTLGKCHKSSKSGTREAGRSALPLGKRWKTAERTAVGEHQEIVSGCIPFLMLV